MDKKVYICTRIKNSRGSHLSQPAMTRSPSLKSSKLLSPNSSIRRSVSPSNGTIVQNNVFTSNQADQKGRTSKLIAVQENVVKGDLLEQYIKTDEDLIKYQHSVLGGAIIYEQDRVFGQKTTQDRLYNQVCKSKVQRIMDGISQTFLFFGPEDGGKQQSFRGGENEEQGCVFRAAEELLNLMEITRQSNKRTSKYIQITSPKSPSIKDQNQCYQLFVQIYCVHGNNTIDLLQKPQSSNNSYQKQSIQLEDPQDNQDKLIKLEIKQPLEFRSIYRHAINVLLQLPQQYNQMSQIANQGHLFVRFNVHRNRYVFSRGTFVKLGDFMSAKETEYKVLGNFLTDISQKKADRLLSNPHYQSTKLVNSIVDSLNRLEDNQCTIINNVSSHPNVLPYTVNSLQYVSKLKSKIDDYYGLRKESTISSTRIGPSYDEKQKNQMSPDEFEDEVNFVIKNVFAFTAITKNYTPIEKQEWIDIQDRRLFTLQQEIPVIFNNDLQNPRCQFLQSKLQEGKLFLKDIPKNFQSQRSLNNSISPQRNSRRVVTIQDNNDIQNNVKRNIMDKIDQAIIESRRQKNRSVSASNTDRMRNNVSENNQSYLEGEVKGLRGKLNNIESNNLRREQMIHEYEKDIIEKNQEIERERQRMILKESREELHIQNEEELRSIISNLKIKLAKKKHEFQILKDEYQYVQQEREQDKQISIEKQMHLQRENEDLETLFQQEKLRSSELEALLQKTRLDMENQIKHRQNLEENFSEYDRRIIDLQNMLHEEQDLNKDLRITNQLLDKKLEDLVVKNEELHNKNLKIKKKSEMDKVEILEQKNKEIEQRRNKTKKLKKELKEIYTRLNHLVISEQNLKKSNNNLERIIQNNEAQLKAKQQDFILSQDDNQVLRNELDKMQQINRDLEELIKNEQQEVQKLQDERTILLDNLDNKERQVLELANDNENLKQDNLNNNNEIKHLQDKCVAQNALIDKIEKQNEFLSNLQDRDIEKLDSKVQIITSELNSLREQNQQLSQTKSELQNELANCDQIIRKLENKYKETQKELQNKKEQIVQLDGVIKAYILEKNSEIGLLQSSNIYQDNQEDNDEEQNEIDNEELEQFQRRSKLRSILKNSVQEQDSEDDQEEED